MKADNIRMNSQEFTQPGYVERYDKHTPVEPCYHNPVSNEISVGEVDTLEPMLDNVVFNIDEFHRAKKLYDEGKIKKNEIFEIGVDPQYLGKMQQLEWIYQQYAKGNKTPYNDLVKRNIMSGGILRREEFLNLKTVKGQANIIAATPQSHVLLNVVTVLPTTEFSLKVYDWTGFDEINEILGDMTPPVSGRGVFNSQTMNLDKYGYTLAFSEEFRMETYDVPVADYHISNLANQLETTKNQRVADIINAITKTVQGSWASYTANLSDRNPATDVDAVMTAIKNTNKGIGRWIISNRAGFNAFHGNTYITGGISGSTPPGITRYEYGNILYGEVPKFGQLGWAVDDMITNATYAIVDPSAIIFADGLMRTVDFENPQSGVKGTATRAWFGAKNFVPSITGGGSGINA